MSNIVEPLRSELRDLEAQASALEAEASKIQGQLVTISLKAEKIRAVLTLYDAGLAEPPKSPTAVAPAPAVALPQSFQLHHPEQEQAKASKKSRIRAEVEAFLQQHGSAHRLQILDHLVSLGLMGSEKALMPSLAAYLSEMRDKFVPDGKGNFSLRRTEHHEPPPAPESGVGSAEAANPGRNPGPAFNTAH